MLQARAQLGLALLNGLLERLRVLRLQLLEPVQLPVVGIAAVFVAVMDVLNMVANILAVVLDILTPIGDVLKPVRAPAIMLRIADILPAVDDVLAAVAHVFPVVAAIFHTVTDAALRLAGCGRFRGRRGGGRQEQRSKQ